MIMRWTGHPNRSGAVSLIGEGSLFDGTLHATSDLRIEGEFQGTLHSSGDVAVGEKGCVRATEVHARNVIIAGRLEGCVQADGFVKITPTGRLAGTVRPARSLLNKALFSRGKAKWMHRKRMRFRTRSCYNGEQTLFGLAGSDKLKKRRSAIQNETDHPLRHGRYVNLLQ